MGVKAHCSAPQWRMEIGSKQFFYSQLSQRTTYSLCLAERARTERQENVLIRAKFGF